MEERYEFPATEINRIGLQSVTRKIHAKSIRFFVSGNNLFYLSKFKLWDPELDTVDGLKYPSMRSLMVGFDLNF